MTIRYSLTLAELAAQVQGRLENQRRHHPATRWLHWLALFALLGALAFSVWNSHVIPLSGPGSARPVDYFALGAPLCGFLAPLFTLWFIERHGEVSISSEEMVMKHPATGAVVIPWRAVTNLDEGTESLTICAKLSWLGAPYYVIPLRAFATSADAEAFCTDARTYWENAVGKSTARISTAWPPAPTLRP